MKLSVRLLGLLSACGWLVLGASLAALLDRWWWPFELMTHCQLEAVADYCRTLEGRIVLAGDLNCTPWSVYFRRLCEGTGLRDSAEGFGLQPTWPVPLHHVGIALDHCLVSDGVAVIERRIGGRLGSDHLPVLVECALTDLE